MLNDFSLLAIASGLMICSLQTPVATAKPRFRGEVPPEAVIVEYLAHCGAGVVPKAVWDYKHYLALPGQQVDIYFVGYRWDGEVMQIIGNNAARKGTLGTSVIMFCPPSPDGYNPTPEVLATLNILRSIPGLRVQPVSTLMIVVQGGH